MGSEGVDWRGGGAGGPRGSRGHLGDPRGQRVGLMGLPMIHKAYIQGSTRFLSDLKGMKLSQRFLSISSGLWPPRSGETCRPNTIEGLLTT